MVGCVRADAPTVRCTKCPHGFFHYPCLANVAAIVANTAMDMSLCASCAREHIEETQRAAAATVAQDASRPRRATPPHTPVKRLLPTEAAPHASSKRRATGLGWCRAGASRNCASTSTDGVDEPCSDWHVRPGESSMGSNNPAGTCIRLLHQAKRSVRPRIYIRMWPPTTAAAFKMPSMFPQPHAPMSHHQCCPTSKVPRALAAWIL